MKANKYVLNRNHTLRSIQGHMLTFIKGEPLMVPPILEAEVIAIGGECVEGEWKDPLPADAPPPPDLSDEQREEQLTVAFKLIIEENTSTDFTGAGTPTVKAVEKIVAFDTTRQEIDTLWLKLKEKEAL